MRARLALAVSEQRCELREVVLRDKPAELLQASPKGTVPVLVTAEGQVIDESLDIMLWALDRNDPQEWLTSPGTDKQEMLGLIEICDRDFKHALDRYKYPQRYGDVDPIVHRGQGAEWLNGLNERIAEAGYLFGATASLADAAIMPFVRQFAQVDRAWFDDQPWPALHAWLSTWLDSALFESIMKKYPPWKEGGSVVFP